MCFVFILNYYTTQVSIFSIRIKIDMENLFILLFLLSMVNGWIEFYSGKNSFIIFSYIRTVMNIWETCVFGKSFSYSDLD